MIYEYITVLSGWVISIIENTRYGGIAVLMAFESANIPIPSEIIMPFSGYLVSLGTLNFWVVVAAGTVGNLVGSWVNYALGYYGGRPFLLRWGKYLLMPPKEVERIDRWFSSYGTVTVFFSRLLPVVRTFVSLPSGIFRVPFVRFSILTLAGSLPWSIALTAVGVLLGREWTRVERYARRFNVVIAAIIVSGVIWYIWHHRPSRYQYHTIDS